MILHLVLLAAQAVVSSAAVIDAASARASPRQAVNLQDLFGSLSRNAQVIMPSDANYNTTLERWTTWSAPSYVGAVIPATEADVQNIIKIARRHDISFLATGGRHGASLGFGTVNNALHIDLSQLNRFEIDSQANTITIGGAVRTGQIVGPLHEAGKEIPTGNAACVGYTGLALGGGIGPFQGRHGLALDSLISARVVTANGDLVTVSDDQHPDLFWAMRGAGANFGIVTSSTFRIYDAVNNGQVVNVDYEFDASANRSLFERLQGFDDRLDPRLAITYSGGYNQNNSQANFLVNLVYFGAQEDISDVMEVYSSLSPTRSNISTVELPELYNVTFFGASAGSCHDNIRFNQYTIGLKRTDVDALSELYANIVDFSQQHPSYAGSFSLQRYSTDANMAVPSDSTAYAWRESKANILFRNVYPDSTLDSAVDRFMQTARARLAETSGYSGLATYVNYGHGDEGPEAWYGAQSLPRLAQLKMQWDPSNQFGRGFPLISSVSRGD